MFLVKNESAAPLRPDRPARPTRCVYCSTLPGMSQFTTCSKPVMSSPRPATSVATRHGVFPDLKSRSAASRFSCFSSPCKHPTFSPCLRSVSPTKFTVLIRFANTSTRDLDRPSFLRNSVTCFNSLRAFLCSAHTCTVCSTSLTSNERPSPLPPAATATLASLDLFPAEADLSLASILTMAGPGASHAFATKRTDLGNVALNMSVWRPGREPIPFLSVLVKDSRWRLSSSRSFAGNASRNDSSCSANPSASMRSASSITSMRARRSRSAPLSSTATSLPGVPTTSSARPEGCASCSSCSS